MSHYVISLTDVRTLGQITVLVIPVMALSYLVTDTEKYKLSRVLESPVVTRVKKVKNPEIYDAILPLIFTVFAAVGFSLGLEFIIAIPHVWQLDLIFISLAICGLIIISQIVFSIVVPTLEKLLEHQDKSSVKKRLIPFPLLAVLGLASITFIVLADAIFSIGTLIFESLQATIKLDTRRETAPDVS